MHCITFAFLQCFMHFRCMFYMLKWCVLVGLDWAKPMMFLLLHVTCSCIFHAYVPFFSSLLILICAWYFYACPSLPLSLSLSLSIWLVCSMAPKKSKSTPSQNPLCSGVSTSDSTPSHVRFRDEKASQDFSEKFFDEAFIQNVKLSYQIFLILTFPLSSTVGVGSPFVTSWSLIPPWSYRSFTPIYMDLITLYLISSLAFEIRAL